MDETDLVDPFHLAARFGVRIIPVEELEREAAYVAECNVALVRTGMTQARREAAGAWILERALSRAASTLP